MSHPLEGEIRRDVQSAPAGIVIYLEGKSDLDLFFALLGQAAPLDGRHQGVLVKGLKAEEKGSGNTAVRSRVKFAQEHGYAGVYGIVDGDGTPPAPDEGFDPPFAGPLFKWKSYSIENLLVRSGWPTTWGPSPDWIQVMRSYAVYVGLNAVYRAVRAELETLRLANYARPKLREPIPSVQEVTRFLEQEKHRIADRDVSRMFTEAIGKFEGALAQGADAAHADIDGKWLAAVHAPDVANKAPKVCREEWVAYTASTGGLAEVRELWQRMTGSLP